MSDKEVEERVYELYKPITGAPRGSVESERAELKALMHNEIRSAPLQKESRAS